MATSYGNAGSFYDDQGHHKKAEEYYLKAIGIYENLTKENPERYNGDLAESYGNAGLFYLKQDQLKKAEEYYLKAKGILEKLVEENPKQYSEKLETCRQILDYLRKIQ